MNVGCIGSNEALGAKISGGVLVSAPELDKITLYQFNQLFESAKAGQSLFEELS